MKGEDRLANLSALVSKVKKWRSQQKRRKSELRCKTLLKACLMRIKENKNTKLIEGSFLSPKKTNCNFKFMSNILGSKRVSLEVQVSTLNNKQQLILKWDKFLKKFEFDLENIQFPFDHETTWPLFFIGLAKKLVEMKILQKEVDEYPFEIYLENQKTNLKFRDLISSETSYITFEDVVILAYLQNLISLYIKTTITFQYELTGFRYLEKENTVSLQQFEVAKSTMLKIQRKIYSQVEYVEIRDISKHPLLQFNKFGPCLLEDHQQTIDLLNQQLVQTKSQYNSVINNILQLYAQPRHVLAFLIKQELNYYVCELKMCLQENTDADNFFSDKYNYLNVSFLVKATNMAYPEIFVEAKEIRAKEINEFFFPLNLRQGMQKFVLYKRFTKAFRAMLLSIFTQFVQFTGTRNENADIKQFKTGQKKVQSIIFSIKTKQAKETKEPIWSGPVLAIDDKFIQKDIYDDLFERQFNDIYNTHFIQKREKDEVGDLSAIPDHNQASRLPQIQLNGDEMQIEKQLPQVIIKFSKQLGNLFGICSPEALQEKDIMNQSAYSSRLFIFGRLRLLIEVKLMEKEDGKQWMRVILRDGNRQNEVTVKLSKLKQMKIIWNAIQTSKVIQYQTMQTLIFLKRKIQGIQFNMIEQSMKSEYINLSIKDDIQIKRHLILGSNQLLSKFFEIFHRSYLYKSKELGDKCSIQITLYLIKKKEYNTSQLAMISLKFYNSLTSLKLYTSYLGFQDIQKLDMEFCKLLMAGEYQIQEQNIQTLAFNIISQAVIYRSFFGSQLNFNSYIVQNKVENNSTQRIVTDNFQRKKSSLKKQNTFDSTEDFNNQTFSQQLFKYNLSQSLNEDKQSYTTSKRRSHVVLKTQLSTDSEASLADTPNQTSKQNIANIFDPSKWINKFKRKKQDKGFQGLARAEDFQQWDSSESVQQTEKKKKMQEKIQRLKGFKNKPDTYSFEDRSDGENQEANIPFLEATVHNKRIVYSGVKILLNSYAVISILRDVLFGVFHLQIYLPKTCRLMITDIELQKFQECSIEFLQRTINQKLFFFGDNSRYFHTFENYARFHNRCKYMENYKNSHKNGEDERQNILKPNASKFKLSIIHLKQVQTEQQQKEVEQDASVLDVDSETNRNGSSALDQKDFEIFGSNNNYVSPSGQFIKRNSSEPVHSDFMDVIFPKSEIINFKDENLLSSREKVTLFWKGVIQKEASPCDLRAPFLRKQKRGVTFLTEDKKLEKIEEEESSLFGIQNADLIILNSLASSPKSFQLQKRRTMTMKKTKKGENCSNKLKNKLFHLIKKHWIALVYSKNSKRLFEFFRKDSQRKVDRIYQMSQFAEQVDSFHISRANQKRLNKLFTFIETMIWSRIINEFLTVQLKKESFDHFQDPSKEQRQSNVKRIYVVIDGKAEFLLRELLHSDFMKLDKNSEFHTSVLANFLEETQRYKKSSTQLPYSDLESQTINFLEKDPQILFIDASNHILEVRHENMRELTVQQMRLNLSEIINLSIAEGSFRNRINNLDSILNYSELRSLSHFVLFKIKAREFFDVIETKTTQRSSYSSTRILDQVQGIKLFAELDVFRKSIEFIVTRQNEEENESRTMPIFFFEPEIINFSELIRNEEYLTALELAMSFYGSKMLLHFYVFQAN